MGHAWASSGWVHHAPGGPRSGSTNSTDQIFHLINADALAEMTVDLAKIRRLRTRPSGPVIPPDSEVVPGLSLLRTKA